MPGTGKYSDPGYLFIVFAGRGKEWGTGCFGGEGATETLQNNITLMVAQNYEYIKNR